jgi:hypothetical protein
MTKQNNTIDENEEHVDRHGNRWTIAYLRAEGFDVAYLYFDKDGEMFMRLNSHAHIPPPNKRFDS